MAVTATTFHSSNWKQEKLQILSDAIMDDFDRLIEYFDLNLKMSRRFYVGACPIHGGDRADAFNFYHSGHSHTGNWYCNSHHCEETFVPSPIGLVRGILSRERLGWQDRGDKIIPFDEAVKWCAKFVNKDLDNIQIDEESIDQRRFITNTKVFSRKRPKPKGQVTRDQARALLKIPSAYYIDRGYPAELLDKYDVGLCTDPSKQMRDRIVFPIYDDDYHWIVGCTGRSIWPTCPVCGRWHNPRIPCPSDSNKWKFGKWRHSNGFQSEYWLYNYWHAKASIRATSVAMIVESPGNVLRIEQANIHNSVGTFGAKLSPGQKALLDASGALTLIVLTDPDDAGKLAEKTIRESCQDQYRLVFPKLSDDKDVGDMEAKDVYDNVHPLLERYKTEL